MSSAQLIVFVINVATAGLQGSDPATSDSGAAVVRAQPAAAAFAFGLEKLQPSIPKLAAAGLVSVGMVLVAASTGLATAILSWRFLPGLPRPAAVLAPDAPGGDAMFFAVFVVVVWAALAGSFTSLAGVSLFVNALAAENRGAEAFQTGNNPTFGSRRQP